MIIRRRTSEYDHREPGRTTAVWSEFRESVASKRWSPAAQGERRSRRLTVRGRRQPTARGGQYNGQKTGSGVSPASRMAFRFDPVHVRAAYDVRPGLAAGRTVLRRRSETQMRQLGRRARVRARHIGMHTTVRGNRLARRRRRLRTIRLKFFRVVCTRLTNLFR